MVILTDDRQGPFYASGHNILAAMDWLVSEPNTQCFLHYSGHGGQVRDPDGDRESGYDDTIVPVDYQTHGQLDSDTLHRHLVSKLHPSSSLFVVFDCCHSGSAIELPFVYRTDSEGNVNLVDSVKEGISLLAHAQGLLQGGFSASKINDAKALFAGAQSFFSGLNIEVNIMRRGWRKTNSRKIGRMRERAFSCSVDVGMIRQVRMRILRGAM